MEPGKSTVQCLGERHQYILVHAVFNVLSTEIAELTLAQIIDGLPLSRVAKDTYDNGSSVSDGHPLHVRHTELCPGTIESTREVCVKFNTKLLEFDRQVCGRPFLPKLPFADIVLYSF